jgi:hypothetical protein
MTMKFDDERTDELVLVTRVMANERHFTSGRVEPLSVGSIAQLGAKSASLRLAIDRPPLSRCQLPLEIEIHKPAEWEGAGIDERRNDPRASHHDLHQLVCLRDACSRVIEERDSNAHRISDFRH